jgi:fatty-acyl-CoA synthase
VAVQYLTQTELPLLAVAAKLGFSQASAFHRVFKGWTGLTPEADLSSFVELDGHRFFRTGDLALVDDEGYFFMRDRLKRMINASGLKVWPAEVENTLYSHPAVQEACVISVPDAKRGETVIALLDSLPESGTGKIMWSQLQEDEHARLGANPSSRTDGMTLS